MKGYNPMRWDCEKQGCFNLKKRPKIEEFADCLPRNISFSDIDARVELNSSFLEIEWKPAPIDLATGQRIMFTRLTKSCPVTVLVIAGDAETMEVTHMASFYLGKFKEWQPANLDDVKKKISRWAAWAQGS